MTYQVKVTREAWGHLQGIRDYIALELLAPDHARGVLSKLTTAMASLATMPRRFSLVQEEPWRSEGVRSREVKNYLIYYWINDSTMTVHVIAVIFERRNQTKALSELDLSELELFVDSSEE